MSSIFLTDSYLHCAYGHDIEYIMNQLYAHIPAPCETDPVLKIPVFPLPDQTEIKDVRRYSLTQLRQAVKSVLQDAQTFYSKEVRTALVLGTTGGVQFENPAFYDDIRHGRQPDIKEIHAFTEGTLAECLANEFQLHGPVITVSNTCVSGGDALILASQWIKSGICDAAIVCAFDLATIMPRAGFYTLGAASGKICHPFDKDRNGMTLGEGFACILAENETCLLRRGRKAEFRLAGCGSAGDAWHLTAPHPEGEGLFRAMSRALRTGGIAGADIAFINAHGTGTLANDAAEVHAFSRIFEDGVPYFSTKGAMGHTLGTSALAELILTMEMLKRQRISGSIGCRIPDPALPFPPVMKPEAFAGHLAMSTSLAFGGCNTALIVERIS